METEGFLTAGQDVRRPRGFGFVGQGIHVGFQRVRSAHPYGFPAQ